MNKKIGFLAFAVVFVFLFLSAMYMHPFGEPNEKDMDNHFIEKGQNDTGANNIVTSVVFDYRGYDTLGEATVLFTAVTGVAVAFSMAYGKKKEMKEMSKIVRTVTNILYSFIIIFGFYIIMHGHLTPGGGFQGGAVVASAFALLVISYSALKIKGILKKENFSVSECSGLFAFIALAFLGISTAFFYNFLAGGTVFGNIPAGINPGDLNTGGVIPLMNIAVGVEVLSGIGLIILYMFTYGKEAKE